MTPLGPVCARCGQRIDLPSPATNVPPEGIVVHICPVDGEAWRYSRVEGPERDEEDPDATA